MGSIDRRIVVITWVALASCTAFGDGSGGGGSDAGPPKITGLDASVTMNDAGSSDASADAIDTPTPDGGDERPVSCGVDAPIVGARSIAGASVDGVPDFAVDAYGYLAPPAIAVVAAGCLSVNVGFINPADRPTSVKVGVYSDVNGPKVLLAQGSFEPVASSWNRVLLDRFVLVAPNATYWFALVPSNGFISIFHQKSSCDSRLARRTHELTRGAALPNPFIEARNELTHCNAMLYMTR